MAAACFIINLVSSVSGEGGASPCVLQRRALWFHKAQETESLLMNSHLYIASTNQSWNVGVSLPKLSHGNNATSVTGFCDQHVFMAESETKAVLHVGFNNVSMLTNKTLSSNNQLRSSLISKINLQQLTASLNDSVLGGESFVSSHQGELEEGVHRLRNHTSTLLFQAFGRYSSLSSELSDIFYNASSAVMQEPLGWELLSFPTPCHPSSSCSSCSNGTFILTCFQNGAAVDTRNCAENGMIPPISLRSLLLESFTTRRLILTSKKGMCCVNSLYRVVC